MFAGTEIEKSILNIPDIPKTTRGMKGAYTRKIKKLTRLNKAKKTTLFYLKKKYENTPTTALKQEIRTLHSECNKRDKIIAENKNKRNEKFSIHLHNAKINIKRSYLKKLKNPTKYLFDNWEKKTLKQTTKLIKDNRKNEALGLIQILASQKADPEKIKFLIEYYNDTFDTEVTYKNNILKEKGEILPVSIYDVTLIEETDYKLVFNLI